MQLQGSIPELRYSVREKPIKIRLAKKHYTSTGDETKFYDADDDDAVTMN